MAQTGSAPVEGRRPRWYPDTHHEGSLARGAPPLVMPVYSGQGQAGHDQAEAGASGWRHGERARECRATTLEATRATRLRFVAKTVAAQRVVDVAPARACGRKRRSRPRKDSSARYELVSAEVRPVACR